VAPFLINIVHSITAVRGTHLDLSCTQPTPLPDCTEAPLPNCTVVAFLPFKYYALKNEQCAGRICDCIALNSAPLPVCTEALIPNCTGACHPNEDPSRNIWRRGATEEPLPDCTGAATLKKAPKTTIRKPVLFNNLGPVCLVTTDRFIKTRLI